MMAVGMFVMLVVGSCAYDDEQSTLLQASIKNHEGDAETIGANMSEADCVHDKHKCRDAFNDCCGEFGNLGSCADGYKVQQDGTCGLLGGDKSYKCCRPTCQHDRTKCRDAFNDCCGEFGNIGTCADGFTAYPVGTCGLLGWQQQYECKFGCHTKPPPKPSRVGREGCELKCYDRHDKLKKDMCYKAKCAGCSGCASLLQASIKNNEGDAETIGAWPPGNEGYDEPAEEEKSEEKDHFRREYPAAYEDVEPQKDGDTPLSCITNDDESNPLLPDLAFWGGTEPCGEVRDPFGNVIQSRCAKTLCAERCTTHPYCQYFEVLSNPKRDKKSGDMVNCVGYQKPCEKPTYKTTSDSYFQKMSDPCDGHHRKYFCDDAIEHPF